MSMLAVKESGEYLRMCMDINVRISLGLIYSIISVYNDIIKIKLKEK